MITTRKVAAEFALSIAIQALQLQRTLEASQWEKAADLLDAIDDDRQRLQQYVNAKLIQAEKPKEPKS